MQYYGRRIESYDPKIKCSMLDLRQHLSKMSILNGLKELSEISVAIFKRGVPFVVIEGEVPIAEDIIIDLAYYLIKYGSASTIDACETKDLQIAARMCWATLL